MFPETKFKQYINVENKLLKPSSFINLAIPTFKG